MNLSEISERLSKTLTAELDYDDDKKEIVAYGIETLILSLVGFLAILLAAFLFNAVIPTVIAALSGGLLRKVSGGAHFNNPLKCLAFGTIVYCCLGVMAKEIVKYNLYSTGIYLAILVLAFVSVAILAPVDSEAKPIHSAIFKRKLKIASIGFVILALAIVLLSDNLLLNTSVVLGVAYQALTLLPVFNKKKKEGDL